ncbi:hypothetical protein [Citrobacter sp. wls613]|uniref:hypothetical protein n=1 Tax=Citrobacter sp. wls613 TaxID=2576436 RepID=UPI0010CA9191|nr:hypothetical protein [Citrobacter sp. wls613]TKV21908.1 hypothetical protein FDX01_06255 [Citrobacter sp. wls613]
MSINENMIVIYVPESLVPGLRELTGPVLFDMDKLRVDSGFALAPDEFVTSLRMLAEAELMSGYQKNSITIIPEGLNTLTESKLRQPEYAMAHKTEVTYSRRPVQGGAFVRAGGTV